MDCSLPSLSLSIEFSKQEYWSGLPFPSPGSLRVRGNEKLGQSKKSWAMGELIFYEEVIKLCKMIQSFDI